ncbi:MAG: prepilin-type N-terminal cleavage/methylation domain-containing protein [Candidatus Omnitrophota bacterium]
MGSVVSKKGFTLLELIIVVIIIGILASIALPQYISTLEKAKSAEALGILGTLRSSIERHWFEGIAEGTYIDADFGYADTGGISLDIDNPNATTGRKWNYRLIDANTINVKSYVIRAGKKGDEGTYWVEINEDGDLAKSTTLGGSGVGL